MSTLVLVYLIFGVFVILALGVMLLIIAGKQILFAFLERINVRGSQVFIANPNRQISHHYKTAKDGVFKIDGKMYVTNPDKLMGLSDDMLKDAKESISMGMKRIKKGIHKLQTKQGIIIKQIETMPKSKEASIMIDNLKAEWVDLDKKIELLQGKLQSREQAYYMKRRGAYFYIENDPVPKDFYEFYTEMDSVQLENVIIRSQTKDLTGKSVEKMSKDLVMMKKLIIFALIAAGVAGWFAFQNNGFLQQIGEKVGVVLHL